MLDEERDAGLRFAVERDVDGIKAGEIELQLLEGDDEIAGAEMGIAGQHDFRREIDAGHDEAAVGIDKIQAQLVRAFILMTESDAQRDGALRVRGGNLLGDDGVERAEQIQLAVFFRGGIAQNSNLNIHPAESKHETGQLARISLGGWKRFFKRSFRCSARVTAQNVTRFRREVRSSPDFAEDP